MNELTFKVYEKDKDKKAFLKHVKAHFGINKIHKEVEPYLLGEVNTKGIFNIDAFTKAYPHVFTCDQLFGKFGNETFPGIIIGGDTYGIEFWLILTTGKVISLHHDATFSEIAMETEGKDVDDFVKKFGQAGSVFNITSLLEFQRLSGVLDKNADDFELRLMQVTAQSLGWSIKKLSENVNDLPMEHIYMLGRDFVDEGGLNDLILAEKKIKKFEKGNGDKADLSFCFLHTLPDLAQKQQLRELNLSGNALQIKQELAQTKLIKLELAEVGLSVLPLLPVSLEYLDISGNDIADLLPLQKLQHLKYLNIAGSLVEDEQLSQFKKDHPGCFVAYSNQTFDFGSGELDLSYQKLKKLPEELAKFESLKKLNLRGNTRIDLPLVLKQLAKYAPDLQSLNLQECNLKEIPAEILELQNLEELVLKRPAYGGNYKMYNDFDLNATFILLSRLPRLKVLPFPGKITDVDLYLQGLAGYACLKVMEFPDNINNKETMEAILRVVRSLPVDTLIWNDLELSSYNSTTGNFESYEAKGIKDLEKVKVLHWNKQSYQENVSRCIFDFPNLETLSITNTDFRALPDEVARLTKLKVLRFTGDGSRVIDCKISPKVGELQHLEELALGGLYIRAIPESIGQLKQLKKLSLSDCKRLKHLPASLTQLTQLEELRLNQNVLTGLPDDLDKLQHLRVLEIWENELHALPEALGNLPHLETLKMRDFGDAGTLPVSFGNLQGLKELEFDGANLDFSLELEKVAQLKNLEKLHIIELSNKGACVLPGAFAKLDNLRELCLYHSHTMDDLTQVFAVISQLENLEELDMTFYNYGFANSIPATLGDFKRLKTIRLAARDVPHELIEELFGYLADIASLRKINAHQAIDYLPATIGKLKNLEELLLSWNSIKKLPKELLTLTQLKKIDLYQCGLSSTDKQSIKKALPYTEVLL